MKNRCWAHFLTGILVLLMVLWGGNAFALTLSGELSVTPQVPGGQVFIGVFDAEARSLVASNAFLPDSSGVTPYSLDLGATPPDRVLVLAFYDRNSSSDPADSIVDWPDYGDATGSAPQNPISVQGADISGINFPIATTYATGSSTAVYDEFDSGLFDPDRWRGDWTALEYVRQVKSGRFISTVRSSQGRERNALALSDSSDLESLKADVMVAHADSGSDLTTMAFARIGGTLYNAVSPSPASKEGDVWTGLYLGRQAGELVVIAKIYQSEDAEGNNWKRIASDTIPVPGLSLDTWYQMEINYDQTADTAAFKVYDQGGAELGALTITGLPPDMGPAFDNGKALTTGLDHHNPGNEICRVEAQFDNVVFNGLAYDDFEGAELDGAKWHSVETVRAMEGDQAVLTAASKGWTETVRLRFARRTPHVYADISVDPASWAANGAKGRVRLEGNFYNDSFGQGPGAGYNGDQGNVWAQAYIDLYDDGSMAAKFYAEKALVPNPVNWDTDYEPLVSGRFTDFTVTKGKTYRLGINFTGTHLIFSCSELDAGANPVHTQTVPHPISGPAYPLEYEFASLTSRVYGSDQADAGGKMTGRFERVLAGTPVDGDNDGISDFDEMRLFYNPMDGDMDGDGIADGNEDKNSNGRADNFETSPFRPDSDNDGVRDGTEIGLTAPQLPAFADGAFIPDADPLTRTDPVSPDTDRDGFWDGQEDTNANGRVDTGESDPNTSAIVSGRVLDPDGNPISGLWVHAFNQGCGGQWLGGGRTDSLGYYTMAVAGAGQRVYVEACARCDDFMYGNKWWDGPAGSGTLDCSRAEDLGLARDEHKTEINFNLNAAGGVEGTVTDASGAPIANLHLYARSAACGGQYYGGTNTDALGNYRLTGIPPGDAFLRTCAECDPNNPQNFVNEWYDNAYDCNDAAPVTVTEGAFTPDIDFSLAPGETISGRIVLEGTDQGLKNIHVQVKSSNCTPGAQYSEADTDSNGNFTISGVPQGQVYIYICPECNNENYLGEWYDGGQGTRDCNGALPVSIAMGTPVDLGTMGIDPAGSISGTVLSDHDNDPVTPSRPVSGMHVQASTNPWDWNQVGTANTAENGTYTIAGLPLGTDVYVKTCSNCSPDHINNADEFYNDVPVYDRGSAVPVSVMPGNTPNIDFDLLPGGSITGRLTAPDGSGAANIHVTPSTAGCSGVYMDGTRTDTQGNFKIRGVPDIEVYLSTYCPIENPRQFTEKYWDGISGTLDCNKAAPINAPPLDTHDIGTMVLDPANSISGRIVKQGTDQGIADIVVEIKSDKCGNGMQYAHADTDANGNFTVRNVPLGQVYIYLATHHNNQNYLGEWYDGGQGTRDCQGAVAISIPASPPVNLGTMELMPGKEVSGTVSGSNPGGAAISVFDWASGNWMGEGVVNADGSFTVSGMEPPPSGQYRVTLESGTTYYLRETLADPVLPDQTGIIFTPVKGAKVYGTVRGDGAGLERICINASTAVCGAFTQGSGYTAQDGTYDFIVPAGSVYLFANTDCNPSTPYSSLYWTASGGTVDCTSAEALNLAVETDTMIDFDLPRKPRVFGTVLESQTGSPRGDAIVQLLPSDNYGRWVEIATDSLGAFEAFVEPGNYYVRAQAPGLARTYHDHVYPSSEATLVEIRSGDPDKRIDFSLDVGGSISGTIFQADGTTPVPDADVRIKPSKHFFDHGFSVKTDAAGRYTADSLPLGLYKVKAWGQGYAKLKYYDGHYGWEQAQNVLVQPPAQTRDIDIHLDPEARISGYIRAADTGGPLALSVIADPTLGRFEGIGAQADVNDQGRYTIDGLPPDAYTLRISSDLDHYVGEFYNNSHTRNSASTVRVNTGDHATGINFDLETGGKILGRVVDDITGEPVREVQLSGIDLSGDGLPATPLVRDDGIFAMNAMPGYYKIRVSNTHGYVPEFYQDAYTFDTATPVEVQALTTTPLVEIRLNQGGKIQGRVFAGDGVTPLAGASLYAFPAAPDMPGSGSISEADGTYLIEGLPTGKYVVKAVTNGYAMQCRQADVTMPQVTPGIDIKLEPYPYTLNPVTEHIIAPDGGGISGQVAGPGEAQRDVAIDFHTGALAEYTVISISGLSSEITPMPPGIQGIHAPVHLGPEGTQFSAPAILNIEYTDQDLVDVSDPADLDIFTLNTDTFSWEKVRGTKTVDYTNKRIQITLDHFSIYQLGCLTTVEADFDFDTDVDGKDISHYINQGSGISLGSLARDFGR